MAIKRYIADADTTITNAFKTNLTTRATGSNMGEADAVEIFRIYAQASSGSGEISRALFKFPVSTINTDRNNGDLPASGSVSFYMRLFNAKHPFTLPRNFDLTIQAVSRSWSEGTGLDLDNYSDTGYANWIAASSGSSGEVQWATEGGDYHTSPEYTAHFDRGYEDLEANITPLVEQWIAGTKENYGVGVFLSSSIENALSSSYTKKFFARGSEFFYRRPIIEARWDSSIKDDRTNFWSSSSLASSADNLNTIYLYNVIRGRFANIPEVGTGSIYLQIWTEPATGSLLTPTPITGGYVSTGIYSASFALNTTESYVYDRWFGPGLTTVYHTGSIKVKQQNSSDFNPNKRYVVSMPNLKDYYSTEEVARFRVFTRPRNWCPNIYTKATAEIEPGIIEDLYYRFKRIPDDLTVIDYGTGSENSTRLSYDASGSYFDLDVSLLEPGYAYQISFIFNDGGIYREQTEHFKIRVD